MLDASFILPAAKHLQIARQIRRDMPALKAQVAAYRHLPPHHKQASIDRARERFACHIAWARHYTEKGRLYTHADNVLRVAERVQEPLAGVLRDKARRLFDRADSLPLPPIY